MASSTADPSNLVHHTNSAFPTTRPGSQCDAVSVLHGPLDLCCPGKCPGPSPGYQRTRRSTVHEYLPGPPGSVSDLLLSPDPARKDHLLLAGLQLAFRGGVLQADGLHLLREHLLGHLSDDMCERGPPLHLAVVVAPTSVPGCVSPGGPSSSVRLCGSWRRCRQAPARVHHDHAPGWQADLHSAAASTGVRCQLMVLVTSALSFCGRWRMSSSAT